MYEGLSSHESAAIYHIPSVPIQYVSSEWLLPRSNLKPEA
jgi:hypothetical protein